MTMFKKVTYRNYANEEMVAAAKLVTEQKISIYKAAKVSAVPWSSLKDYLNRDNPALVPKLGRPYALTSDLELKLFNYIIQMQELGFGLTVLQVRKIAYSIAMAAGVDHFSMKIMNLLANGGGLITKKDIILL